MAQTNLQEGAEVQAHGNRAEKSMEKGVGDLAGEVKTIPPVIDETAAITEKVLDRISEEASLLSAEEDGLQREQNKNVDKGKAAVAKFVRMSRAFLKTKRDEMKAAIDGSAEGTGAIRDVVGKGMTKVQKMILNKHRLH